MLQIILYFTLLLTVLPSHYTWELQEEDCKPLPGKTHAIPPDGTYCIDMAFEEYNGRSMGVKLKVFVKGYTAQVIYLGGGKLTHTKPGDVLEEGELIQHKSGVWLFNAKESDKALNEVGGCVEGPTVIDFLAKKFWWC